MAKDSEVKIVILLEDKASKGLKAVGGGLRDLGSKAGKIAAVGLAAAAAGLIAVGVGAIKLAADAAPLQGVMDGFEGLATAAGVGGDAMLEALQKGSQGMITNRDLMMSFNKASQLVGQDFAVKLPDAMQYLSKVAAATGEDMGFMMDSLVTGVGRLSPMILDNLGMIIKLTDVYDTFATGLGKTRKELTTVEKQTALVNEVMRQGNQFISYG